MTTTETPIEIFRAGRHTDMGGRAIAFAETDLAASAAAYDPALHEAPIVVGHPRHDAPAYGWVGSLVAEGGRLTATPRQVNADFAELVRAGSFKKVSASFYLPDAPGNPKPGTYYLRHVGFLGAQPPAIKGLTPVNFAEGEEGVVEFGEEWIFAQIGRLFRGMREWIIGQHGQERADEVIPSYAVDDLVAAGMRPASPAPAFAEPPTPPVMEKPPVADENNPARTPALEERERALAAREAEQTRRDLEFAERATADRRTVNTVLLDRLITEGRFLPSQRDTTLAFMDRLDAAETVSFSEGAAPVTELDAFRALLATYPPVVSFGEFARPGATLQANPDDADDIASKSVAYQEAMAAKGIAVSNIDAVKAVTGNRA